MRFARQCPEMPDSPRGVRDVMGFWVNWKGSDLEAYCVSIRGEYGRGICVGCDFAAIMLT
jgi:hypothetical protein